MNGGTGNMGGGNMGGGNMGGGNMGGGNVAGGESTGADYGHNAYDHRYNNKGGNMGGNMGAHMGANLGGHMLQCRRLRGFRHRWDRRLKRYIRRVGKSKRGFVLYSFQYIWGGPFYVGVMAQDLLTTYPEAVSVGPDNYFMVDYSKLDFDMMTLAEWEASSHRAAAHMAPVGSSILCRTARMRSDRTGWDGVQKRSNPTAAPPPPVMPGLAPGGWAVASLIVRGRRPWMHGSSPPKTKPAASCRKAGRRALFISMFLCCFAAGLPAARAERRVAMVIGNAAYQNVPPLNTPTTDAAEVSKLLRSLDFSVIELTNVDKVGMERALRQFSAEMDRADVALFYYSGHGVQVGDVNYLVPISAKIDGARSLALDTIALQDVNPQCRKPASRSNSCFSTPAETTRSQALLCRQGQRSQPVALLLSGRPPARSSLFRLRPDRRRKMEQGMSVRLPAASCDMPPYRVSTSAKS